MRNLKRTTRKQTANEEKNKVETGECSPTVDSTHSSNPIKHYEVPVLSRENLEREVMMSDWRVLI